MVRYIGNVRLYLDGNDGHGKEECERTQIPPIRNFRIIPHELGMNVVVFDLHFLDTVKQASAMIQDCVDDDASAQSEREQIGHRICRREIKRRIIVVGIQIEAVVLREYTGDIVDMAESVVGLVARNWEVGQRPGLPNIGLNTKGRVNG